MKPTPPPLTRTRSGSHCPGGRWAWLLGLLLTTSPAPADSIVNSKHNLSSSGPGTTKAATESEICIFCHTPHNGSSEAPLWNRYSSGATYTPYSSATTKAVIGQPTGASKLCLSCHDGTIALGMTRSRPSIISMQGGVTTMPSGVARLGGDLADDHPVSFVYDASLASQNGQLKAPSSLTGPVRLDKNQQLQCTACHDPHNNHYGKFLVRDNTASALCNTCHDERYWTASIHNTSVKTWNGSLPDPWPHTEQTTVAANGCENCHRPHTAGNKPRLLNVAGEESNCYPCHNGNVAAKNIQAEFNKASIPPIAATTGVHDPTENPVNPTRHVECADCHNPHAAKSQTATVPTASGYQAGVKGISASGTVVNPLVNQYELCFRCHADSTARGTARVTRRVVQTNTRLEFQSSSLSYHPIEAIGKNASCPSLISPWTTSSLMYCTDCHNNNQGPGAGGAGPKGPHGSAYVPLLERQLTLTDGSTYSSANSALCYKCHSETSIRGDASFPFHSTHVNRGHACTTCHDPHGVASNAHLINFNTTYVTSGSMGGPSYTSTGTRQGTCTLTCHGEDHQAVTYPH